MDFSVVPVWALFVITLIASVASGFFRAYYIKKKVTKQSSIYLLNAFFVFVGALVLFAINGFKFRISLFSVLLGLAFGLVTMLQTVFHTTAMKLGPWGYTDIITNFSTAITALSGWLIWGEDISWKKFVGIALIIACFILTANTKGSKGRKGNFVWFILCVLAMVFSASIGLLQKVHQSSEYAGELNSFLIIAFVFDFLFTLPLYFIKRKKELIMLGTDGSVQTEKVFTKMLIICALIIGIASAINNSFNLYLSGIVPTAVFFPIVNGVPLMSSIVLSFTVFKEKLKKKQTVGLLVGLTAIVFLLI